jgi:hypothetical protein
MGFAPCAARGETPSAEELFPARVGEFSRAGSPGPADVLKQEGLLSANEGSAPLAGQAEYIGKGSRLLVEVVKFHQDAEAYGLLTAVAAQMRQKYPSIELSAGQPVNLSVIERASFVADNQEVFFKGLHFVRITVLQPSDKRTALVQMSHDFADTLDKGEGDLPPLLKHLPNPDEAQKKAVFLTRFTNLQSLIPQQQVLGAIDSGGNADAVLGEVGQSKVLIVEFNTPQLASDNDQRIIAKIHELWKLGQRAPTAYRRVGNYSVFVFDAPDEQTAKQLIDQVKYEQTVQWLGENPNILKEAQRRYVNTTLGVFIAVVKASGFALIGCFGAGGLIGALLFLRRRAQQRSVEAFSDAGGMLRLNLDDLTHSPTEPSRLLRDRN